MKRILIASLVAVSCSSFGLVVPNSADGIAAPSTFNFNTTSVSGRTYQFVISSSQLTSAVGQNLTGMSFRLNESATAAWPVTALSYSQFDITIGAGVAPSSISGTFADNFTGSTTQVRAGALNVAAGAYSFGGNPNVFGPTIAFDLPYLYSGGNLTVELRMSNVPSGTPGLSLDAVAATGGVGYGTDFAAKWTGNSAGTAGSNGNFVVTDFSTEAVPEPMTLAVLALGGLAMARRRRK